MCSSAGTPRTVHLLRSGTSFPQDQSNKRRQCPQYETTIYCKRDPSPASLQHGAAPGPHNCGPGQSAHRTPTAHQRAERRQRCYHFPELMLHKRATFGTVTSPKGVPVSCAPPTQITHVILPAQTAILCHDAAPAHTLVMLHPRIMYAYTPAHSHFRTHARALELMCECTSMYLPVVGSIPSHSLSVRTSAAP